MNGKKWRPLRPFGSPSSGFGPGKPSQSSVTPFISRDHKFPKKRDVGAQPCQQTELFRPRSTIDISIGPGFAVAGKNLGFEPKSEESSAKIDFRRGGILIWRIVQTVGGRPFQSFGMRSAGGQNLRTPDLDRRSVSSRPSLGTVDSRSQTRHTQAAMNAEPLLAKIASALADARLEAVMVGNAAAALRGAPVTTLDIDFMFRKTRANMEKLKRLADNLQATILKPYYPVSGLYRLVRDDEGLQVDFMSALHGIRTFEGLRARADQVSFGDHALWVASLRDIINSKRAAGRPRDLAVLTVLEITLDEQEKLAETTRRSPEKGKRKGTR